MKLDMAAKVTSTAAVLYFFYYLCRLNYSFALPFMQQEFHVSSAELGAIATALTLGYAVGQLINGFMVDRRGPKIIMAVGGIASAVLNVLMGWNSVFGLFLLIWAANGYFQAMGYPSSLRLIANWYSREDTRGMPLGINEGLQAAAQVVFVPVAALLAIVYGWRMIFIAPSITLFAMSIIYYLSVKNSPQMELPRRPILRDALISYRKAFGNWRLDCAYLSYGFSQFIRYALITWIPLYFYQASGQSIFKTALFTTVLYVGGSVGSPLIGYLHDHYFTQRKWMLIAVSKSILALATAVIGFISTSNSLLIIAVLMVCGVLNESLAVAYFLTPVEIMGVEGSATGVGCMNAVGKFVASLQGVLLGILIDLFGFNAAFVTAGLFSLGSAALILPMKNNRK